MFVYNRRKTWERKLMTFFSYQFVILESVPDFPLYLSLIWDNCFSGDFIILQIKHFWNHFDRQKDKKVREGISLILKAIKDKKKHVLHAVLVKISLRDKTSVSFSETTDCLVAQNETRDYKSSYDLLTVEKPGKRFQEKGWERDLKREDRVKDLSDRLLEWRRGFSLFA